jgi:hypothetical protein
MKSRAAQRSSPSRMTSVTPRSLVAISEIDCPPERASPYARARTRCHRLNALLPRRMKPLRPTLARQPDPSACLTRAQGSCRTDGWRRLGPSLRSSTREAPASRDPQGRVHTWTDARKSGSVFILSQFFSRKDSASAGESPSPSLWPPITSNLNRAPRAAQTVVRRRSPNTASTFAPMFTTSKTVLPFPRPNFGPAIYASNSIQL